MDAGIRPQLDADAIERDIETRMDCYVYVLGSLGNKRCLTYVGWTDDVERRLERHNAGKGARTTRGRIWVLLHCERFASKREAMSREWHLKRDRKFRKALATAYQGSGVSKQKSSEL